MLPTVDIKNADKLPTQAVLDLMLLAASHGGIAIRFEDSEGRDVTKLALALFMDALGSQKANATIN